MFLSAFLLLAGLTCAPSSDFDHSCLNLARKEDSAVWQPGSKIHVCWQNLPPNSGRAIHQARLVQAAASAWSRAGDVEFVGWDQCIPESVDVVRITLRDERPTAGVGKQALELGVTLNFSYSRWSPWCQLGDLGDRCVVYEALHEFGHVLGFEHEHERDDTPPDCRARFPEVLPHISTHVTPYSPDSVMNYCGGMPVVLSPSDEMGVSLVYGAPAVEFIPFDIHTWWM